MSKRKIDNLTPQSTASEMEQAIKEFEVEKTNPVQEPEAVEVKEVVEEKVEQKTEPKKAEKPEVTEAPKPEKEVEKEVVEDNFDYKKGYEGLRSWQTKMAQDVADMKRVLVEKASEQPKQPVEQQMTMEQLNEWYNRDPVSAMAWVQKAQAEQMVKPIEQRLKGLQDELVGYKAQSVINKFRNSYSDFQALEDEIRDEVLKLPPRIQEDPALYDVILDNVYWSVKGKKLKSLEDKTRKQSEQEAERVAKAKKELAVEGSAPAAQETPQDTSKMTSAELFEIMKSRGAVKVSNN